MNVRSKLLIGLSLAVLAIEAAGQTPSATPAQSGTSGAVATQGSADIGITPNLALGDVTVIDTSANAVKLHTKDGDILVILSPATAFKRMPLDAKLLKDALPAALSDVGVGDRVIAIGKVSDDRSSLPARQLIVMSKADVARKQERDREAWKTRGVTGRVVSLNSEAHEIVLTVRNREGERPLTIADTTKTDFRRYAPDSVKFSDAKPSSYAELKVGDQVRVLGTRSDDGNRFTPEEIVSGSFTMVTGTVSSVDVARGEILITNLQNRKPLTIVVNKDSLLRRFPAEMAAAMARFQSGGAQRGPTGAAPGPAAGTPGPAPAGAPAPGSPGSGRGFRGAGDFDDMLERLPVLTLAELKRGDVIAIASAGTDATRVTAIKLLSGIEPFLAVAAAANAGRPASAPSMTLPGFDSVGLP